MVYRVRWAKVPKPARPPPLRDKEPSVTRKTPIVNRHPGKNSFFLLKEELFFILGRGGKRKSFFLLKEELYFIPHPGGRGGGGGG